MRVAFRVEGDPKFGLGHLMRCLALAQALDKQGHSVFFMLSKQSMAFCRHRADWCGELITLPKLSVQHESQWVITKAIELSVDWLVLDGYQFEQSYRLSLITSQFRMAIFDDMNNSGVLNAQLVINGAAHAEQLDYQNTAPNAMLALGCDYQVLRQEFVSITDRQWSRRQWLTLLFGGSDPYDLTLAVLQELSIQNVNMPIKVITGAAYKGLSELQRLLGNCDLNIRHLHDSQDMATQWLDTKLAISAAGGSQFELLACATPALLVVVAENQKLASDEAIKQGWCKAVTDTPANASQIVKQSLALWEQPDLLQKMHQQALKQTPLNGANNIIQLMQQKSASNELTE